jgi:hypothetical protein
MYASLEVEQFHKAVFRGKKKEVKALVSDAVVNGTRSDGVSALHIVASTGSTRICKLLLSHRPALEARESHGASPLNLACQNNNSGVVRLLLEAGVDVNSARSDGVTPLYIAAQEGHAKVVQLLLQYKVVSCCRCVIITTHFFPQRRTWLRRDQDRALRHCLWRRKKGGPKWWSCWWQPEPRWTQRWSK